jgi:hypothetical protein
VPPLSHLTSCTPTESNLYLANSLAAVVRKPALYKFLTLQVPSLISPFHCLGRTKGSVHIQGPSLCFAVWDIRFAEQFCWRFKSSIYQGLFTQQHIVTSKKNWNFQWTARQLWRCSVNDCTHLHTFVQMEYLPKKTLHILELHLLNNIK